MFVRYARGEAEASCNGNRIVDRLSLAGGRHHAISAAESKGYAVATVPIKSLPARSSEGIKTEIVQTVVR